MRRQRYLSAWKANLSLQGLRQQRYSHSWQAKVRMQAVRQQQLCQKGRRRYRCKQCGGSTIHQHGRRKSNCTQCGGSGICQRGRDKSTAAKTPSKAAGVNQAVRSAAVLQFGDVPRAGQKLWPRHPPPPSPPPSTPSPCATWLRRHLNACSGVCCARLWSRRGRIVHCITGALEAARGSLSFSGCADRTATA